MNNEKHGNEYLAMIQEQNPNFNPEETLAMLNALTAMTKTYEDHQKQKRKIRPPWTVQTPTRQNLPKPRPSDNLLRKTKLT